MATNIQAQHYARINTLVAEHKVSETYARRILRTAAARNDDRLSATLDKLDRLPIGLMNGQTTYPLRADVPVHQEVAEHLADEQMLLIG